jgi:glycosidase
MQNFLRIVLFFVTIASTQAQVVTTQPTFPTADTEVTIIVDLKLTKDGRARALLGKTDDVYLWSGAGATQPGNAFEFQPAGQTSFNQPFAPGRMTALGNDRWQIKLVPRTYFNVPTSTPIRQLGLLLKNGNGQAQTEDFTISIYDNKLSLLRLEPMAPAFFVDINQVVTVRYKASRKATISLTVDGQKTLTLTNTDSLRTILSAGTNPGQQRTVIAQAIDLNTPTPETISDTFRFTVRPQPIVAALPIGLQDGINYTGTTTATLVLYAPKKTFVHLLGEFNDWTVRPAYLMKRTPDGLRYWLELTGLPAGQEVSFAYLVDGAIATADPYADKILDRNNDKFIPANTYPSLKAFPEKAPTNIVSVLQTNQTPFVFKTDNFLRPAVNKLVIYELLIRDFVQSRSYQTLTDSLAYLKRLGINTIELMPITEFTGNDSWGYNPIFYLAPDKAYGTKTALKIFIDAAHQQGIAVVLDVVFNQADYEFPYVKLYWDGSQPSVDSPYFNQQATHPFSVFFDFNHESPDTRKFVDRVCKYWLQEYKIDGFRFDLSKGFTQTNTGANIGAWSTYDASRVAILKRIYDQIRTVDPTAYVILEHFADISEERELANYGLLLWGNHNGDFRNALRPVGGDFSGLSYRNRAFDQPNLIGYAESHDEERLVYDMKQTGQTAGSYSVRNQATALDRAKLAAAFLLLTPGPKMIWQFGELGYDLSINTCSDGTTIRDDCRTAAKPIRWDYYQNADRLKLVKVYAELIRLKTNVPAFTATEFTLDFANTVKRLTMQDTTGSVFLIGNFDTRPQSVTLGIPSTGTWYHHFSGQPVQISDVNQSITLEPGAFHLYTTTKQTTPETGLLPFAVAPSLVTAIDEPATDTVLLSPNPVQDLAIISISGLYRGTVNLTLTDVAGRAVRQVQFIKAVDRLQQSISLQTLSTGTYFLTIKQGEHRTRVTVLKN